MEFKMNEMQRKQFIKYLTDILGIKKIYLEQETVAKVDIIIYVENYGSLSLAESELLKKMIEALKLEQQSIKILDLQNETLNQASLFQIYLVNNPLHMQNKISKNTVVTFSPTILNVKTQFKKEAWNEMQKAIAFFRTT